MDQCVYELLQVWVFGSGHGYSNLGGCCMPNYLKPMTSVWKFSFELCSIPADVVQISGYTFDH